MRKWSRIAAMLVLAACSHPSPKQNSVPDAGPAVVDQRVTKVVCNMGVDCFVFPDHLVFTAAKHPEILAKTPGDILVSQQGLGFLRKVLSVTQSADHIVVQTSPAALDDALVSGRADATLPLIGSADPNALSSNGLSFYSGQGDFYPSPGATLSLKGSSVQFDPSVDFHMSVDGHQLTNLTAQLGGTLNADLFVTVALKNPQITHEASQIGKFPLWESPKATSVIFVGELPVVLVFSAELVLETTLEAEDTTLAATEEVQINGPLSAGITYDQGQWSPTSDNGLEVKANGPTFHTAIGGASLTCALTIIGHMDLYDVIGPYISLSPYVGLEADIDSADPTMLDIYGDVGVYGGFGADIGFLSNVFQSRGTKGLYYQLFDWNPPNSEFGLQKVKFRNSGSSSTVCKVDSDCNDGHHHSQMVCGVAGTCVQGCHASTDCPAGIACTGTGDGRCVSPDVGALSGGSTCTSDADCNGGNTGSEQICNASGTCAAGCHADSDCLTGFTCSGASPDGQCSSSTNATRGSTGKGACSTDQQCTGGLGGQEWICGQSGQCATGCHHDSDCPGVLVCDTTQPDGECTSLPPQSAGMTCSSDQDCNAGQVGMQVICGADGNCVTGCHADADCASGLICQNANPDGTCQQTLGLSGSCMTDTDCSHGMAGQQQICGPDGLCTDGCNSDADCPGSQICDTNTAPGTCVSTLEGNPCSADSQCNGGQEATGLVCGTGGTCVQGCHAEQDCPSGTMCNTSAAGVDWPCIVASGG